MMKNALKLLLLFFIGFSSLQCSNEDDEGKDIEVNINPLNPAVFTAKAPILIDGEKVLLSPPWIVFYLQVVNGGSDPLYINSIEFSVSYTLNGVRQTANGKASLGPADINNPTTGEPYEFSIPLAANGDLTPKEPIYIQNLPNATTGAADSFVFTIEGLIQGYRGETETKPDKAVSKRFTFTTSPPN